MANKPARLWNAAISSGITLKEWGDLVDTVSLCFSKGMGAPVGSVLVGPDAVLCKAYELRKLLGGGMRQAGVLANACLYALDHHYERLQEDHDNAKKLGEGFAALAGVDLDFPVETNLVWFKVAEGAERAQKICEWFESRSIMGGIFKLAAKICLFTLPIK